MAAIVLCGGNSERMGRPKASLPFGHGTMLQQVVAQLNAAVRPLAPIVIVAAHGQTWPQGLTTTKRELLLAHDEHPDRGPLEGLVAGLKRLAQHRQQLDAGARSCFPAWTFATSCDTPLISPHWPHALASQAQPEHQAVIPSDHDRIHPLAAIYRLEALEVLEDARTRGELRLSNIADNLQTRLAPVDELRAIDPELDTLVNVNTPAEYSALLRRCGLQEHS